MGILDYLQSLYRPKNSMEFRVGEGLSPEQKVVADEVVRKPNTGIPERPLSFSESQKINEQSMAASVRAKQGKPINPLFIPSEDLKKEAFNNVISPAMGAVGSLEKSGVGAAKKILKSKLKEEFIDAEKLFSTIKDSDPVLLREVGRKRSPYGNSINPANSFARESVPEKIMNKIDNFDDSLLNEYKNAKSLHKLDIGNVQSIFDSGLPHDEIVSVSGDLSPISKVKKGDVIFNTGAQGDLGPNILKVQGIIDSKNGLMHVSPLNEEEVLKHYIENLGFKDASKQEISELIDDGYFYGYGDLGQSFPKDSVIDIHGNFIGTVKDYLKERVSKQYGKTTIGTLLAGSAASSLFIDPNKAVDGDNFEEPKKSPKIINTRKNLYGNIYTFESGNEVRDVHPKLSDPIKQAYTNNPEVPKGVLEALLMKESSMGYNNKNRNLDIGEKAWLGGFTKIAKKELIRHGIVPDLNTREGVLDAMAKFWTIKSEEGDDVLETYNREYSSGQLTEEQLQQFKEYYDYYSSL